MLVVYMKGCSSESVPFLHLDFGTSWPVDLSQKPRLWKDYSLLRTKAIEKTSTGEQLKSLDLLFLTCGLKMTVGGPRINEALLLLPGGLVLGYNHAGKTTF